MGIQGLHHNAWRCRDSEETRRFYEDFLGLTLTHAFPIGQSRTGRSVQALHSFFQMEDGSFLAFFEVPGTPFDFKAQHDFDLHIALGTDEATFAAKQVEARAQGMEVRGPVDHGFIRSIYFRDPNGYVVELTVPIQSAPAHDPAEAHAALAEWQRDKNHA